MLSVKGQYQNGVIIPSTYVEGRNGQQVIITFLEESLQSLPQEKSLLSGKSVTTNGDLPNDAEGEPDYDPLMNLIAQCATDTGIADLAHEHDHYLYGTPKRGDYGE